MDRLRVVQVIIYFVALAVVIRLIYWQFIADIKISSNNNPSEAIIPAARGDIFTADKYPIVTNQEAYSLFVKPNKIDLDTTILAGKIAPLLTSDKYSTMEADISGAFKEEKEKEIEDIEDTILKRVTDKSLFWIQIARKITRQTKESIDSHKLSGVIFNEDTKRFYPEASMAAHLLGFVGSNEYGEDTGYFGLEGYYDNWLKGKDGRSGQVDDPLGLPILVTRFKPIEPKKGGSLQLSIDRGAQFIVETRLREAVLKYGAKEGTVIITDPKTGRVLAMASVPSYVPNLYGEYSQDSYRNPAVADTYEPGSTFKLITMAAALDAMLVEPDTKCAVCGGPRNISGYEISTWNKKYYPNSTMVEVIQHSDNVGMTYVSQILGPDKFVEYIRKFGFGQKTEIDLQEEAEGVIRNTNDWKEIDLATASFGQGIAVTPIQMVQAIQAIANNGYLISPKVVNKLVSTGREETVKAERELRVVSAKTASQITEMMVNAVEQGEAKAFAPKGYRIAGKTGTAQIPVAGHYDPEKTVASFIGFAPADEPKFAMLVRFTEPTSSIFGSETAAPTFFAIAKDLFVYWGISPSD